MNELISQSFSCQMVHIRLSQASISLSFWRGLSHAYWVPPNHLGRVQQKVIWLKLLIILNPITNKKKIMVINVRTCRKYGKQISEQKLYMYWGAKKVQPLNVTDLGHAHFEERRMYGDDDTSKCPFQLNPFLFRVQKVDGPHNFSAFDILPHFAKHHRGQGGGGKGGWLEKETRSPGGIRGGKLLNSPPQRSANCGNTDRSQSSLFRRRWACGGLAPTKCAPHA